MLALRCSASTRPTASPKWGHDFRPSYLRLGATREPLGNPPALALTATATPRVRNDMAGRLRLRDPVVLIAPAYRENLRLAVEIVPGAEKFAAAGRAVRGLRRPGIIYCATTTAVDQLAGALKRGESATHQTAAKEDAQEGRSG